MKYINITLLILSAIATYFCYGSKARIPIPYRGESMSKREQRHTNNISFNRCCFYGISSNKF